jgi:hypothetical protein
MSHVEKLTEEITKLSRAEREQLLTRLAFVESQDETPISREQRHILETIATLCDARVSDRALGAFSEQFVKIYGRKKFDQRSREIFAFIEPSKQCLRPEQSKHLLETCLKALADDVRHRNIPVTAATILNNVSMLPIAVDRKFPGYVDAGLLHRVVQ